MKDYLDNTDVKKKIMTHLKKSIEDNIRFENLTLETIVESLRIPESRVKKAMDELENSGDIVIKESGHILYIPRKDEKSARFKKFKLEDPGQRYTIRLVSGMLIELLLVSLMFPKLAVFTLTINSMNQGAFLIFVFVIGLVIPLFLGMVFLKVYNYSLKRLLVFTSKLGLGSIINRHVVNVAAIFSVLYLVLYLIISLYIGRTMSPFEIVLLIGAGFTTASIVIRKD